MFCCGGQREKLPKQRKGLVWKFSYGSTVFSESFVGAVNELDRINPKEFWASETEDGKWDVQLSDTVVVPDIKATSVMEAVRIARWRTYLDRTIKKINDYGNNVF